MTCPNCQTSCGENDRFCYRCGTRLCSGTDPVTPATGQPIEKKGSHWVPILILVLLSALGIGVYFATTGPGARQSTPSDTPWFTVYGGTLYFDQDLYTGGSTLTVPDQVDGQTVRGLGMGCFEDCDSLTTVILPDTLESIGAYAFSGCDALRGIFVPDSVSRIGMEAFSACSRLEAVCISQSVTSIGTGAFADCGKLSFILYLGSYDEWCELYDEFINPYTGVYCQDGSFYQGRTP